MENMEDLKKLYEYINNELIPKYDGLEKCTMHILPDVLEAKVEFLIKANENLDFDDFIITKNHLSYLSTSFHALLISLII